jgi:hypothetical protein
MDLIYMLEQILSPICRPVNRNAMKFSITFVSQRPKLSDYLRPLNERVFLNALEKQKTNKIYKIKEKPEFNRLLFYYGSEIGNITKRI